MADISSIILPIVSTVLALISLTVSTYSWYKARGAQERLKYIRENYPYYGSYQREYRHNSRKNSSFLS